MNPAILLLSISLATWGIGEGLFLIFQPFYLTELGADPIKIGFILGAAGIAMTITHTPAGYLSDRIGSRPMLIASWVSGLVATAIMAFSTTLNTFTVGLLLYSFTAFVSSPLGSYTTSARGNMSVTRAVTFTSASFNAGTILGATLGGWISETYELRTIYFVAFGLFILSTLLIFFLPNQPIHPRNAGESSTSIFRNRPYFTFLFASVFLLFFSQLSDPFNAKFLQEFRGVSYQQIGYLGSMAGIGRTTMLFVLGSLPPHLGALLGLMAVALFDLLILKFTNLPVYYAAMFLSGGLRATKVILVSMLRPFVRQSNVGLAYGIAETFYGSTLIFAPVVAGYLYDRDPETIYISAIIGIVITAGIFFPLAGKLKTPTFEEEPE